MKLHSFINNRFNKFYSVNKFESYLLVNYNDWQTTFNVQLSVISEPRFKCSHYKLLKVGNLLLLRTQFESITGLLKNSGFFRIFQNVFNSYNNLLFNNLRIHIAHFNNFVFIILLIIQNIK